MKNIINTTLFKRVYQKLTACYYNISYSQAGEDLIIEFLIGAKKIDHFTYLDIGANHPTKFNNTYKFYEKGYRGVCIEPNPVIFSQLNKVRKNDICLNLGIGIEEKRCTDFYIMDNPFLNTFSKEEAENLEKNKHSKIKNIIQVDIKTTEHIIGKYFKGISPVFVNLDVEGLDEEIIRSFPFNKYRPYIFCIETVHFTDNASSDKRIDIMNLMDSSGYIPFADTYINTIFIDKNSSF